MQLVDTHCHIHEASSPVGDEFVGGKWAEAGFSNPQKLIDDATRVGVTRLICVGTSLSDSEKAIELAAYSSHCWASIGIHPHEAKDYVHSPSKLQKFCNLTFKSKLITVT